LDLVVRHTRLVGQRKLKDIATEDGRIVEIADRVEDSGEVELDAKGRLASPGFVDAHMHLDKALLGQETPNLSGTLREAISIMGRKKSEFTVDTVKERAGRVVEMAVRNGTTTIRTMGV